MPVVRGFHQHQHQGHQNLAAAVHELGGVDGGAISAGGGDVDGDGEDNRTYCFCDGVSYGEMIACDDEECEREWVSGFVCFCPLFPFSSFGSWWAKADKFLGTSCSSTSRAWASRTCRPTSGTAASAWRGGSRRRRSPAVAGRRGRAAVVQARGITPRETRCVRVLVRGLCSVAINARGANRVVAVSVLGYYSPSRWPVCTIPLHVLLYPPTSFSNAISPIFYPSSSRS